MLFDKLCGYIERWKADELTREFLEEAAIIKFPDQITMVAQCTGELLSEVFLPLPVTAIESEGSVAVVRFHRQTQPDQPGIHTGDALEVLTMTTESSIAQLRDDSPHGYVEMMHGFFEVDMCGEENIRVQTSGLTLTWGDKRDRAQFRTWVREDVERFAKFLQASPAKVEEVSRSAFTDLVLKVLLHIHTVTAPGNWVVQERGTENVKRKPTKAKKIARSHQRPRFLVITDKDRVRYARRDETTEKRTSPVPHVRRAHWRKLGTDESTGRPIYTKVRAAWVGNKEVEIGGTVYEVRTDL